MTAKKIARWLGAVALTVVLVTQARANPTVLAVVGQLGMRLLGMLYALSPATVPSGLLIPTLASTTSATIAISPDGKSAYVGNWNNLAMYSRDTTTGILTPLATPTMAALTYNGMVISPEAMSQG